MELTLAHQSDAQISVICDGQPSHIFDFAAISSLRLLETQHYPTDPITYGQALYNSLFLPGTLAHTTLAAAPERIVLITPDDDLDAFAWEYLYGPGGFLVQECHFVRALPTAQRIAPPTLDTGLHIVAIPSNPLSTLVAPLNIDAEWQRLSEIVHALPCALTLERTRPPTIKQLRAIVAGQHQRVVHFMGHGGQHDQGAVLAFEKDDGDLDLVQARDFALRLRGTTFLITLNACDSATPGDTAFSNLAAVLVRQKIPYALGMRFPIPDDDARLFSRTFYADLAGGSSVEEALLQARLTLASESLYPWMIGVPVLYTSLATPVSGFVRKEGTATVLEHQPHIEVSTLPRAEGIFQGRTRDLTYLGKLLTGDNRPRVLTLHGGGGQGKTALARETVERFAHAWPGGVWGISLENLPDRARFATELARFLGLKPQEIGDPADLEQQILTRLTGPRTLLVLDNTETLVEAIETNATEAHKLTNFLQQLPSTSVSLLVTSRVQLGWPAEETHELGGLTAEEGAQLFQQSAPQRKDEIALPLARELSRSVEGHPLSLRLLGGAFNASAIALSAFVQQAEHQLVQAENKYLDIEHRHRKLYACIETSLRYLDANLRTLLSGLWIFHAPFLAETAVAIFDPDTTDTEETPSVVHDQLHTLWQRGLLTRQIITVRDGTLQFYHLLPTTRPYIEQHLPSSHSREELLPRFATVHTHIVRFLYDERDRSASAIIIAQQTEADLERAGRYLPDSEQTYYKVHWAQVLSRIGTPQRSLKLLEDALEQAQENQLDLISLALNNMALIYTSIGQGQRALRLYEALPIMVDNHAGEALTFNNMAEVYRGIGQWQRALSLYEQALPIMREVGNREVEATILNNMAEVYRSIGQWQRALSLYEQTLPIMREVNDRALEAMALNNMAAVYYGIGQSQRALSLLEQALPIMREVGNRAGEATTFNNMAAVYYGIGQWQRALSQLEQALPIMREVCNRAGEATTFNNMAEVYRSIGQSQQALSLYEQALPIMREVGNRAGEALALNNMAVVYHGIGQSQQALSQLEQALPIMREVGDRAGEAMTLNNMAVLLYQHFKHTQDALTCIQQALDVLEQTGLPQDAARQTREQIQSRLEAMRQGMPLFPEADSVDPGAAQNNDSEDQR